MSQYRHWPPSAFIYRSIDNLHLPWIPSPAVSKVEPWHPLLIHGETKEWDNPPPVRRRRRCGRFWQLLKDMLRGVDRDSPDDSTSYFGPAPTQSDFKAYGQWARPYVNGTYVDNATSVPVSATDVDLQELFNSLRGPRGTPHPQRWIPGLQHPSLPPRPPFWHAPRPGDPLPFPWECKISFLLQHRSVGFYPIAFDIRREPDKIVSSLPSDSDVVWPINYEDLAQPATWPFLSHMDIHAVADDTAPIFPWSFVVHNPNGITCRDVFETIYDNFSQYVREEEHASWCFNRQVNAQNAYNLRVMQVPVVRDALRRVDYLGDRIMFRGLEPSPDKDGTWVMFAGPLRP